MAYVVSDSGDPSGAVGVAVAVLYLGGLVVAGVWCGARLASPWPTMKRSSSETISRGEKEADMEALPYGQGGHAVKKAPAARPSLWSDSVND